MHQTIYQSIKKKKQQLLIKVLMVNAGNDSSLLKQQILKIIKELSEQQTSGRMKT
jgi:thymidylate kinase